MDPLHRLPAISDLRREARRRIPHFIFEYLDSATGIEDQKRRNAEALNAVQFWPEILKGPMTQDLSTRFLGRDYLLPFGISPVGMSGVMWPGAEKILASEAKKLGLPYGYSCVATVTPETLAPHIGDDAWFQIYMPWNREIRADMLARAKAAGFRVLVITVDVPVDSTRERQRRANLNLPMKMTPDILWQVATHPRWALGTLREGVPSLKFLESYAETVGPRASTAHAGHTIYGQPSWRDVEEMQTMWDGPVMVKGVQKPDDARRLAEMGVDAIWVSNHSGRQFDGGPASIDCLPAIRDAVPDAPLIYDSGIGGGLDILRAIALGADFVMMGRAWHYAVAALGRAGPKHLVDILTIDMRLNMGQIGAERLDDLAARLVARPLAPGAPSP